MALYLALVPKVDPFSITPLEISAGSTLTKELPKLKRYLKTESARLQEWHRSGAGGREVCAARSRIFDTLLLTIFDWTLSTFEPTKRERKLSMSLVAIGGYGRSELNPQSDIDIMLLHNGSVPSVTRIFNHELIEKLTGPGGLIYTLYDLGMKVGSSVRNIQDAVLVANDDMQTKTSLIEARLVGGDAKLLEQLQQRVETKCVRNHIDAYLKMRIADQDARRVRFGNSALLQVPNIKNGCGGLRDYQNLLWMTHFKYGTRTLEELQMQEMIRPANRLQLEEGYDFLLRVRNELHYQTERASDNMPKAIQVKVAWQLGYKDRSPARRLEAFMRDLYQHMRRIHLITRMVERRLALRPKSTSRIPSLRMLFGVDKKQETLDGFHVVDGELVPVSKRVFKDQPRRLMRVFLHAQQRGLEFHPDLIQLLRDNVTLVDDSFVNDPEVHETFLEILNQRGNVAPALRAMHEVDLLGRYIPEFGRMTCLVQHEFFHAYAADEHTLVCLEKLDQVWDADQRPLTDYTHILQDIDLPYLLYLALFLHDAGKGLKSGDHVKVGTVICLQVGERLGLTPRRLNRLKLLVENHLLMAEVSQRRDIDSPTVIRHFAEIVQDEENLAMLTLLTFADSLGTSDDLWNDFKNMLLQSLYRRARRRLASGVDYDAAEKNRLAKLKLTLRDELPQELSEEELEAHFNHLTPRYFRAHSIRHILTDLGLVNRFFERVNSSKNEKVLEPIISWQERPARGYTSLKVCTWDRPGLFTTISGVLAAAGLNILSARVFSRSDGVIIDTFFVVNAKTGGLARRAERDQFAKFITQALLPSGDTAFEKQVTPPAKREDSDEWQLPTRIRIDTQAAESRTIVEVESKDRLGLLHRISKVLTRHDLSIHVARISTEKGAAIDTFYVRTSTGGKPTDEKKLKALQLALEADLA